MINKNHKISEKLNNCDFGFSAVRGLIDIKNFWGQIEAEHFKIVDSLKNILKYDCDGRSKAAY